MGLIFQLFGGLGMGLLVWAVATMIFIKLGWMQ